MKYDSPSPGTGKSFMACSSGGINRSSKIFVIFVPVGPRAAGPGITAGVVLTAAVFSGIFGCVAGILPPVSAFSAGTVIFGFSSGFFCSGTGAGFTVAAFSGSFGGVTGVLLSASAFSAGAAAFGFSSAFFCSGSGAAFTSAAFSGGFGGVTGTLSSVSAFSVDTAIFGFPPAFSAPVWVQVLAQRPFQAVLAV